MSKNENNNNSNYLNASGHKLSTLIAKNHPLEFNNDKSDTDDDSETASNRLTRNSLELNLNNNVKYKKAITQLNNNEYTVKFTLDKPNATNSTSNSINRLVSSPSSLLHNSKSVDNVSSHDNSSFKKSPSRPLKRQAPKIPEEILRANSNREKSSEQDRMQNFYINIENVRWFYKNDKEPQSNPSLNQTSSYSLASLNYASLMSTSGSFYNLSGETITKTPSASNLNSPNNETGPTASTSTNDINNNSNNQALSATITTSNATSNSRSTIHSSKKWQMFNKWDSYNLEVEYRKMLNKTQLKIENNDCQPNLVQVLDRLFEVNLTTKKCYPIYWKSMKSMTVRRCLWYKENYEPLDETVDEMLEKKHIELFRDSLVYELENGGNSISNVNSDLRVNSVVSSIESASLNDDSKPDNNSSKSNNKNDKEKTQTERKKVFIPGKIK
jgi:hypothetical protein